MKVSAVLLLILISGCSAQYTRNIVGQSLANVGLAKETEVHRRADWVLTGDSRLVLVSMKAEDYPEYPRSVHNVNEALLSAFQKRFFYISSVDSVESSFNVLKSDVVVVARLGEQKNNLNSKMELFEGKSLHEGDKIGRDYVHLELSLFDARSRKLLDTLNIRTQAAYFSDSDQTLADLIRIGLDRAVETLAAVPQA